MAARKLRDLVSVGPATLRDFSVLGVQSVSQLAKEDPTELYLRLCKITEKRHDPCCEDVFRAAVEQARDLNLSAHKKQWWYWSQLRLSSSRPAQ